MNYRVGTVEDWPKIVQFLIDTDYFIPVDPGDIGGRWFIAEQDGEIKATLWSFGNPPNAYIDYFASSSPMVAARLIAQTQAVLKAHGIRFVRATIPKDNLPMVRLANWFGMNIALDYTTAFKEIK
jgi:hypothetical protein